MTEERKRVLIDDILWRMDQAWTESYWHALWSNLEGLTWEEAMWAPMPGRRTIRDILGHVGLCKIMYWEYAFGPAKMTWPETGELVPKTEDLEDWRGWLQAAQDQLRAAVAGLTDNEMMQARQTNWGEELPTRDIINRLVEHDLYHVGEINYIRGLYRAHRAGDAST